MKPWFSQRVPSNLEKRFEAGREVHRCVGQSTNQKFIRSYEFLAPNGDVQKFAETIMEWNLTPK